MMTADPNDPLNGEGRALADLPWYLAGTLPEDDRRAMVGALKRQPALIDALDGEIQMRRHLRAAADLGPVASQSGFDSLMARIDLECAEISASAMAPTSTPSSTMIAEGCSSDSSFADTSFTGASFTGASFARVSSASVMAAAAPRRTGRARWLALAAAVALVLQAGTLALLLDGRQPGGAAATYRTASAPVTTPAAATIQATVLFADSVSVGRIRTLLDDMDARIANGPMPDGAFIVDLAAADDLAALQAQGDIVRHVERVR